MKSVSPVSTPYGSPPVWITMQIDSGVWPGVCRISSSTSPRERRSPSSSRSMGNSTCAAAPNAIRAPGGGGQLEGAGEEVGVHVGLDHALDHEALVGEVAGDVPMGSTTTARPVVRCTHQVGRLGEASEVVLPEEQPGTTVRAEAELGHHAGVSKVIGG